jgi:ABC-type transporter Mla subunit MlaD
MNDAISRALGRAGELEAMVHNEVTLLERSYEENERKIRGLIQELSGERHALVNTSDHVSNTLQRLGGEIPSLIDKLSDQQIKLAKVIEGASDNLTALETSLASSVGSLESAVGGRTDQLQHLLESYTEGLAVALGSRTDQLQATLEEQLDQLDSSFGSRTENLQTVFEEYARALDAALANRAQALDHQLIERTRSLDHAFAERLRLFDESIMRSTAAIDAAVVDKTQTLTAALDAHASNFRGTIGRQATDLDEALMHGINSVRRASENVTRQSIKAMEGLANQSDLLRGISENLLGQISGITGRFENQGQQIMNAASALETANFNIDKTLQTRHADLTRTLERLSGKADEFAHFVEGYSGSIEGSLSEADVRARNELERIRSQTNAESERTLEDMRHRLSSVSSTMTSELGSLTDRFAMTSEEMRQQAVRAAAEITAEQSRLREQLERLPIAAQESSESMRRALQDQIKALDQLSILTSRAAAQRDVTTPVGSEAPPPPPRVSGGNEAARSLTTLSSTIAQELGNRQRRPAAGRAPDSREGWSLGDLLARASRDEEGSAAGRSAFNLDLEAIARALDAGTASAIWSRLRAGQRGVMVRSIYSDRGRAVFDDVSQRCRTDADLTRAIGRYLADFERAVSESDLRDPSGRLTQNQLVSDAGRVYLFLAHACGRLG